MYQLHFNSINSTQIYLKENLDKLKLIDKNILISCSNQTNGIGRTSNIWDFYPNSIAISFTLSPNETAALTPLEVGLLIISFVKKKFNRDLFLKWPNDIMTMDGKKCGGILCQYIDASIVIVGVGLNLGKIDSPKIKNYPHGLAAINQDLILNELDHKQISKEIYEYFLNERIKNGDDFKTFFNKHCLHIDKEVLIHDSNGDHVGFFKGIGNNGEALVEIDTTVRSFFSSSLTILN